jgi:F-box protein 9
MGDISSELEAFREQWHREVAGRSSKDRAPPEVAIAEEAPSSATPKSATKRAFGLPLAPASTAERKDDDEVEDVALKTYHDLGDKDSAFRLGSCGSPGGPSSVRRGSTSIDVAPVSALEHYEKAVEKESQGSLGESLSLYRKAYRVCPLPPSYRELPSPNTHIS